MARKQDNATKTDWKDLIGEQEDLLRPIIRKVLQEVRGAEMDEALGVEMESARPIVWATVRDTTRERW